jgi:hypothetical protein
VRRDPDGQAVAPVGWRDDAVQLHVLDAGDAVQVSTIASVPAVWSRERPRGRGVEAGGPWRGGRCVRLR